MTKPIVTVLSLGGTIAMTRSPDGGVVPTLTGETLTAAVPGLSELACIDARSFRQLPGAHLTFDDLEDLAAEIWELGAQGRCGVVVTQGTDTIEESAFALDRLLDVEMPVIVTGAMRNPTVVGADGAANLLAAVQVAVSDDARGIGCLVVLNEEVHAARFVRKLHTSSLGAFGSPLSGPIGWVGEGRVRFCCRPPRIRILPAAVTRRSVRVPLITITLGDTGECIEALLAAECEGMVVEAMGGGHVPLGVAAALEKAARRMPVVLASRTGSGETLARTYGFRGGEIDLQQRGLIRAGWLLDGLKARVLLSLLLRGGLTNHSDVAKAFEPWGGA